jgi:secondary thiamine-phosphate synthase enzyme
VIRYINVRSRTRTEFIDITDKVQEVLKEAGVTSGVCYLYVPHTTAAVTVNEGADPICPYQGLAHRDFAKRADRRGKARPRHLAVRFFL